MFLTGADLQTVDGLKLYLILLVTLRPVPFITIMQEKQQF